MVVPVGLFTRTDLEYRLQRSKLWLLVKVVDQETGRVIHPKVRIVAVTDPDAGIRVEMNSLFVLITDNGNRIPVNYDQGVSVA
jgi:hypothetical protein